VSGIANIFNVPGNEAELAVWASAHLSHHRDINRRIFELTGIALSEYVLDPIDPFNSHVWEAQHQIMHTNMDAILGIDGFDLSDVDFTDPDTLAGWITLNANEHYIASNVLGIG